VALPAAAGPPVDFPALAGPPGDLLAFLWICWLLLINLWPQQYLQIILWDNQLLKNLLGILVNKMDVMLNQGTLLMEAVSDREELSTPGTFLTG
jgi:hypothetical protein